MEFKLNKVDTELRQRINEERSEDKIHNKKGININKDKNEEKDKWDMLKKGTAKEKQQVEEKSVADKEIEEPDKGHNIDIRR